MSLGIINTYFTPSEAEKISGLSVTKQRDLRRHGFLPEVEGHARFDAYDVAELLFVQKMSARGVGPKHAFEVAKTCATGIVHHALGNPSAYKGDHLTLIEKGIVPPVIWDDQEIAMVEGLLDSADRLGVSQDLIRQSVTKEGFEERRQAEFLQRYITALYGGKVLPAPYFIWWADNSEFWAKNIQDAFDDVADSDPKRSGPVIIISLESLGQELLLAAEKPLFQIKVR